MVSDVAMTKTWEGSGQSCGSDLERRASATHLGALLRRHIRQHPRAHLSDHVARLPRQNRLGREQDNRLTRALLRLCRLQYSSKRIVRRDFDLHLRSTDPSRRRLTEDPRFSLLE